jgi:hypothetical protein
MDLNVGGRALRVPTYQTQQLIVREQLTVPGEFADYNLSALREGECVALLFKQTNVAVLICGLGGGAYRIAAKPIPPHLSKQL